jgi:hypothetical protein
VCVAKALDDDNWKNIFFGERWGPRLGCLLRHFSCRVRVGRIKILADERGDCLAL